MKKPAMLSSNATWCAANSNVTAATVGGVATVPATLAAIGCNLPVYAVAEGGATAL